MSCNSLGFKRMISVACPGLKGWASVHRQESKLRKTRYKRGDTSFQERFWRSTEKLKVIVKKLLGTVIYGQISANLRSRYLRSSIVCDFNWIRKNQITVLIVRYSKPRSCSNYANTRCL